MKRIPWFSGAAGIACALMMAALLSGCSKEPGIQRAGFCRCFERHRYVYHRRNHPDRYDHHPAGRAPAAYPLRGWCSEDSVYVRSGPGKEYGAIGGAHKGEQFSVLGREGDWYKVQHGEDEGYISAQFIRFSLDEAMATTAAETTTTVAQSMPEESAVPGSVNRIIIRKGCRFWRQPFAV